MANYGIRVTNPGSVVIIDGTSNMFKIAATGTLTRAFPTTLGTSGTTVTTLTALGTGWTTPPAMLANTTRVVGDVTNYRIGHLDLDINASSGVVRNYARAAIALLGTEVAVSLRTASVTVDPATTGATRYYVLIEAGI